MSRDLAELAQTLFEEAGDALFLFDPDTDQVLEANPMAQRLSGFGHRELLANPVGYFFRSEVPGGLPRLRRAYQNTGLFHSQEGFFLRTHLDGQWVPVNITVTRLHARPKTLGLITARDLRERRRAEQELRDSEQRYRQLFEGNPHPMLVCDADTLAVLAANNAASRTYGYDPAEFLTLTLKDLQPPGDVSRLVEQKPTSTTARRSGVWRHRKKDGTTFDAEVVAHDLLYAARPARLVLVRDVTERRQLEEQLRQSQKMEAVGQLAGGVAHDFNNLLTVISGFTELLAEEPALPGPVGEYVTEIRKATGRAADLTRQLLAFSRRQILTPVVLRLDAVVADMQKLLRPLIGEHVELVTDCDPDTGQVRADPGQLEQVVMNLVVNARDAMPDGGRVTVRTRNVMLDDSSRRPADARPGPYVLLSVADAGCGMDEATRVRIFEPFFTTKEKGKGTGLGLATVYGIVKQSEGHLEVDSAVGLGSTFRVYLPRVQAAAKVVSAFPCDPPEASGGETVLLAEDDPGVRELAAAALRAKGYHVWAAADGLEALRAAVDCPGPIDLLVTDVVMPHLGGRELAARLTAAQPGLPVLFTSGYTEDNAFREGLAGPATHFLPKPFTPAALAAKVRQVLGDGRRTEQAEAGSQAAAVVPCPQTEPAAG